jgi:hypothetical protein
MDLSNDYKTAIAEALRTPFEEIQQRETPWGMRFWRGNGRGHLSLPIDLDYLILAGSIRLPTRGRVIHELVAYIKEDVPPRDHPEESDEIVKNIGTTGISFVCPPHLPVTIQPGRIIRSVQATLGYQHGFKIEEGPGLLYVVKALYPHAVDGDTFKI